MLKNKIYKYLSNEILKNFITILFTFTAIAWVARAVNFLDLMVDDGYSSSVYLNYSILNITSILTRFVPISFLLSLIFSITKFERQQELLILWTTGLAKIKIANIFLLIAFFISLFQLILLLFVNPFFLNKSRSLLKDNQNLQINTVLKSNDFSDTFKGVTFYIDEKNSNNELLNIFIDDSKGSLGSITNEINGAKNSVIIAKKGSVVKNKLILFDGIIQSVNNKNEFKNIQFQKTELNLFNISTRTVTQMKIQETSTIKLLECFSNQNSKLNVDICSQKNYIKEVKQVLSRRLGTPLYIPLIAIITSFLLIYKKEKKYNYLKKYMLFGSSFLLLIFGEISLKYTGASSLAFIYYFVFPVIVAGAFYIYLLKTMVSEKISK
jgi:lipopolysaccharide export system permease protein